VSWALALCVLGLVAGMALGLVVLRDAFEDIEAILEERQGEE